jgi:hypothetical protein
MKVYILCRTTSNGRKTYYDASPDLQGCYPARSLATEFTSLKVAKAFRTVEAYWGNVLELEVSEPFEPSDEEFKSAH